MTIILGFLSAAQAVACMALSNSPVKIQREETAIVWDDQKKIEHFIRKVDFKTSAKDLGFLVPVPAKPEIAEADGKAFERLQKEFGGPEPLSAAAPQTRSAGAGANAGTVTVLEEKRVAGLDVAVLEASNAKALADWLSKNGYPSRPAAEKWLESYVKAQFKIVAFKYAGGGPGSDVIASKAVRLSFAAPYPFYPYKEPSDAESPLGRQLRVYLFAPRVAHAYTYNGTSRVEWTAATTFSGEVSNPTLALAGILPPAQIPSGALTVTSFLDGSLKRPDNAELFFERAP
ncbi:MAG: DUF2330 domain-containing protein [Deltaproteobacteria bacterium]|nr:DUF2330 domain-containing protein [Deltaproteobacteria bacterium]